MDKDNEMSRTNRENIIKKEKEEAAILEKELAKERREEVSRMVEDLEKKSASHKEEKAVKKEMTLEEREKKAEEILEKVNRRKQEEIKTEGKRPQSGTEESSSKTSKSRKKRSFSGRAMALTAGILAAGIAVAAGAYFFIGSRYRTSFLPGTIINGADVSGMTADEVKELISDGISSYTLTVKERGDQTETITKDEINLKPEFDGSLERIIDEQDPNRWLMAKLSGNSYEIETMISYDEALLNEKIQTLNCMNEENVMKPTDARVSDYMPGQGYTVVPEEEGNELNPDIVKSKIGVAIQNLKPEISLEEEGCYKEPTVRADDERLKSLADSMNAYVNVTVTYKFGDQREVLNGDIIHEWLVTDGTNIDISLDGVKDFVQMLATKYNTAYRAKTLKTSYGQTVTISRGNYGWRINQAAEVEQLMAIIRSGESQEREPVYSQTAASHGENDYGNTYVEINLTAQHLFFYKDGNLLVESDFVSGNVAKGYTTPPGAYPLTYKERNATLKGQGYSSPVSYWMPFNGGIGMHDANWRSSFGGNIYKTNGSHGCINLPPAAAKTIYENISKGMPVLCYNLGGTEKKGSSQTSAKPAETPAAPPETAPQEQPPVPEETPAAQPTEPSKAPSGPGDEVGMTKEQQNGPGVGM
ncbi:L,D-transpeptidase family protein [Clostridium sp. AM58-1XD]|uniref:L,D-transpeptidase family protein n=1 Tax=Clostridium sp. AM58-1XD TaxID=2292307 RepID=UPI001FA87A24|nr:L,D-transpeptidase family protein [Clostridium sp. AM58-1XD]